MRTVTYKDNHKMITFVKFAMINECKELRQDNNIVRNKIRIVVMIELKHRVGNMTSLQYSWGISIKKHNEESNLTSIVSVDHCYFIRKEKCMYIIIDISE